MTGRSVRWMLAASFAFATATTFAPTPASAAPPSTSDERLARDKLVVGTAAAERGDWDQALSNYRQSYALDPRPLTLFSLAGAEVRTGHVLEGLQSYRKFLEEKGVPKDQIALAQSAVRAAEARLARLTVHVPTRAEPWEVHLDEATLSPNALVDVPVDPRSHVVALFDAGREVARATVAPTDGQKVSVTLAPPPPVTPAPVPATEAPAPPPRSPSTIGLVFAGVSVAALGTSAAFGAIGLSDLGDLKDGCGKTSSCAPDDVDAAKTKLLVSDIALAVGAVTAGAAVYFLFFAKPSPSASSPPEVRLGLTPRGFALDGRF